jgi:hypothetical protein
MERTNEKGALKRFRELFKKKMREIRQCIEKCPQKDLALQV